MYKIVLERKRKSSSLFFARQFLWWILPCIMKVERDSSLYILSTGSIQMILLDICYNTDSLIFQMWSVSISNSIAIKLFAAVNIFYLYKNVYIKFQLSVPNSLPFHNLHLCWTNFYTFATIFLDVRFVINIWEFTLDWIVKCLPLFI